jgi:hypothetical protein
MHGPEKSDSVIVAVKPANKAGQPAAESAEPRTGTKGNAAGKARAGQSAGQACYRRWTAYGKQLPSGPEVGAGCGKAASPDLCGGRSVMSVPTATGSPMSQLGHFASVPGCLTVDGEPPEP